MNWHKRAVDAFLIIFALIVIGIFVYVFSFNGVGQ